MVESGEDARIAVWIDTGAADTAQSRRPLKVPETGTVKAEEIDSEVDSNRRGYGGPEIVYFTI